MCSRGCPGPGPVIHRGSDVVLVGSGARASGSGAELGVVAVVGVGLWAFLWGFLLLNRAHARGGYEPGLGAKGATHIVGGILAMNGVATLKMAAETFGLQALLQYLIE